MKGIIFTSFIEMVEEVFGIETMDNILNKAHLKSGGSYTSVGTYEAEEMMLMVEILHQESKIPIPMLLKAFGKHLFSVLISQYYSIIKDFPDGLSMLESIENHIHREVKKLYPDAMLPTFEAHRISDKELELIYTSDRKLADVAEGLIEATMVHFHNYSSIKRKNLNESGTQVKFKVCNA
ncbi:hypothetical protein EYV94_16050 [Puteibacter caeruleilacunae]|nr:hypothetical protein EYV94_16050 [Puteibacter caeruleilacunae]